MSSCVFCGRLHDSKDCFQMQKMPLHEKKDVMKKKKARYLCLRQGHRSAECKTNLKCLICGKRHSVKMCADLPVNNRKGKGDLKEGQEADKTIAVGTIHCNSQDVLLQKLLAKLKTQYCQGTVRAILYTEFQRSYIQKITAVEIKCQHVWQRPWFKCCLEV